jgi:phage terminase large subunit-like protein
LCDEVHEHPDRGVMEMLERGFKFRRQPLLFMITNSGTDRNSIAWEEHEHAVRVAAGSFEPLGEDAKYIGEVVDDTTFPMSAPWMLDDDPLNDPTCWVKANPLLGVTITEEYLAGVVAQAQGDAWEAQRHLAASLLRLDRCRHGVDDAGDCWNRALPTSISRQHHGQENCCRRSIFRRSTATSRPWRLSYRRAKSTSKSRRNGKTTCSKPTFDAWVEAWTPKDTLAARELADKLPYAKWVKDGHLHAPNGASISYLHVAQTLAEYDRDFDIEMVAYDRFAFRRFRRGRSTSSDWISSLSSIHRAGRKRARRRRR